MKKVTFAGTVRFQYRLLYIATALCDHLVGFDETDDGIWSLYFNTVLLGKLDERDGVLHS